MTLLPVLEMARLLSEKIVEKKDLHFLFRKLATLSAIMSIGLEDCNGRHWMQPLFAPTEKIYDSRMVSYKDYISEVRVDAAIECFKNPMLW